ncbi:g5436 [Coccomyxa viridis]|uniref:G5436 protein n=1 Tax=Coccomyxa viridis TaxID=1274662 RepID=A0ABP1FZM8_9CHLO
MRGPQRGLLEAEAPGSWGKQQPKNPAPQTRALAGTAVGVAAVEEIVEAQHAELMSFAALPRHLMKQRDSLLSLQNVESLTDELAQLSQDLERLTTSEGATISDSPGSSEVSEEDYKRIHAARKQHEMEMQAQARRELRAARRKASAERAASERAKQQLETPELAASSAPAIASRSDTRPARGEGRAGKAAPLLRSDKQAKEGSERQLRGARATAAARTRGHSAWGKRHVPKAGRDSFTPAAMPKSGTTALSLSAVTRMEGFGSAGLLTAAEEKKLGRQLQELLVLEDVKHKALNRLGRQISSAEWMTLCEMTDAKAFKKIIKTGEAARLRMVKSNERLVWHVARKYQNRGLDIEDLIAEGMNGLLKGVEKFDPNKGFKFSTYAHWWVRQGITRAISEQARVIRVPVHIHELMSKMTNIETTFRSKHGHAPSQEKLAGLVGITVEKLQLLLKAYQPSTSFNAPLGYDQAETIGDVIADEGQAAPEEVAQARSLQMDIDKVLSTLTEREADILRARYGLDDGKLKTLEEVGVLFEVTRERIRQIEAKAILKLRSADKSAILRDYLQDQPQEVSWRAATSKARA